MHDAERQPDDNPGAIDRTTGGEKRDPRPPLVRPPSVRLKLALVVLLVAGGVAAVWLSRSGEYPLELGRRLDPTKAVGVAEALADGGQSVADHNLVTNRIVIRGRIGEVCRSAGCWFVLHEIKDGLMHEVLVDLKRRADFSVKGTISGHRAIVAGRLVDDGSNVVLEADGVRIE